MVIANIDFSTSILCSWMFTTGVLLSISDLDSIYNERCFVLRLLHRFVMDRYGQVLKINLNLHELKVDIAILS